jgi:polysaccharide export outer membrane protein
MRKSLFNGFYFVIAVLLVAFTMSSCNTTRKIKYFQDIPDSGATKSFPKAAYTPIIIHTGDILNVTTATDDPLSMAGAISAGGTITSSSSPSTGGGTGAAGILSALSGGTTAAAPISGFPVDDNGNITMPILGKIAAAGYTTAQLTDIITLKATKYFKNPVVIVKLINFKVDVTGEVLKPGQYTMPEEKENIMDVISMAGDLTVFGKRENVLLIRENPDGTKTSYRIDLRKSNILSSPLYYVRPNDVIYIEPRSAKSDANDASQARYATIATAVLGLLIIIATRVSIH